MATTFSKVPFVNMRNDLLLTGPAFVLGIRGQTNAAKIQADNASTNVSKSSVRGLKRAGLRVSPEL